MLNSLSQTLLKIAAPGVPDFYQGTELWELNLVDPDNRRPVDFGKRRQWLGEIKRREIEDLPRLLRDLLHRWQDGKLKLYLIYKALNFRRAHRPLFDDGDYLPLAGSEKLKEHVCAFFRTHGENAALVVIPRLIQPWLAAGANSISGDLWIDEWLTLPERSAHRWQNIFTGEEVETCRIDRRPALPLARLFERLPVALLASADPSTH
jgi:(1->4)-alpha-D-glucan 1-alpha-D-glucosylmutase